MGIYLNIDINNPTCRLHKPQCDLEPSWEDDELDGATARTINLVHSITSSGKSHDEEEETNHKSNHFTAPGFCYLFPLLKLGKLYNIRYTFNIMHLQRVLFLLTSLSMEEYVTRFM